MKKGRVIALLTALAMAGMLAGCGSDSDNTAENTQDSQSISEETAENDPDETAAAETDAETDETSESGKKDQAEKKTETTGKTDQKDAKDKDKATETTAAKSSDKTSGDKSSSDSNGNTGKTNSGDSTSNNTGSKTDNASPAAAEDEDETENAADPIKYIYLKGDTAQYSGDGISVSGSVVTIGKGGTYEISGTLDNGQIYINTDKKKVKLHLNGASITNKAGSAINCQNAKKLTISTLSGTENYLEDGGNHDDDKGTVFSEDTVTLKGEGTLNITANFAHGVQSDDDIIVNGGTINITSTKSGLHSNDGIEINGGWLFCDGGTNGIKTDGYITITGGSSVFIGGSREEKGAIYCDGVFSVLGGQFWAIGNTFTTPDAAETTANVIGLMFPNTQQAGTIVNVVSGGNGIFTMTSPRQFKYAVYAGPDLLSNAEYSVSYGGSCDGNPERYVYFGGSYSGGTDGGSFTAGNTVTFYTVPQ
ncbi:MAG: carbohydrate-binding domain-containing protein [Oscillospiraceae bacterium]|nr:carbohydrate-binding domain-containing protein [Oscillospiraceae bacterium]